MQTTLNCNDDVFSKFINRARKKLSKAETEDEIVKPSKTIEAEYVFTKSPRTENFKKLELKVKALLKSDPNTTSPILKLIDHKIYDNLCSESKERYILQLSSDINKIKNSLVKM